MTRLRLPVLAICLVTVFFAGLSGAADRPAAEKTIQAPSEVTSPTPQVEEGCDTSAVDTAFLDTALLDTALFGTALLDQPITNLGTQNVSLKCNCNSDRDCKAICGEGGGTCFIGPVCSNWPDYTGQCFCKVGVGDN